MPRLGVRGVAIGLRRLLSSRLVVQGEPRDVTGCRPLSGAEDRSGQQLETWWDSPEYAPLRALRQRATTSSLGRA
jgi:uncharacterized protein (DUF1330 family)